MAAHTRLQQFLLSSLLLLSIVIIVVQGARLLEAIQAGTITSSDFCPDYLTAQHWLDGKPIYTPTICWSRYSSTPQPLEYDAHPPPSLFLVAPFALLSYSLASWLWGSLNLACLIASILVICREVGFWSWRSILPIFALFLLWEPTLDSTRSANLGAGITALLLVLVWRGLRRGQQWRAGILAGAVILLKLLPILLLPYFLLRRQKRAVISASTSLLLGVSLSLLLMGSQAWADYLGPVRANEGFAVAVPGNISLEAYVVRLVYGYREFLHPGAGRAFIDLPPLLPGISLSIALLLGFILAGLVLLTLSPWFLRRSLPQGWEESDDASFACLLIITSLLFPRTWYWELVLLAMPLLWLAAKFRQSRERKARWSYGVALCLLAIPFNWLVPAFQMQARVTLPWPVRLVGVLLTALPSFALVLLIAALWPWLKAHTQGLIPQQTPESALSEEVKSSSEANS